MAKQEASIVVSAVDKATEVLRGIGGQFSVLQSGAAKLGAALGALGGAAYFTNLVKQSIEAADRMGDLAAAVGVPVETLSKFKLAADVSGASVDSLANGLKKLSVNMFDTAAGTGEAQIAFKTLGVQVAGSNGALRASEEVLLELAEKFSELEDGATKTALAVKIFGRSGAELIPFLNNGKEGLEELTKTAEALGLVLSEDLVSAADRTNDMFTTLGQVTAGLGNKIMAALLPTLEGLAKQMLDTAKDTGALDLAVRGVVVVFNSLVTVGAVVWTSLKTVGTVLASVVAAATLAVEGNFKGAAETLKQGFADAGQAAKDSAKWIYNLWTGDMPKLTEAETRLARAISIRGTEQKKATAADKEAAKFAKELADGWTKFQEAYRSVTVSLSKGLQSLRDQNAAMRFEISLIGKTKDEIVKLEQARIDDTIAKKESLIATMRLAGEDEKHIVIIKQEIEALKERRGLLGAQREAEIAAETREVTTDTTNEWSRAAEQIEQSLTDALVRGFEGGKGFVKSIGDYIVNYFRSVIARGIAQALMGAIGVGLSGAANASGGGGLSSLGSMLSLVGGGSNFAGGVMGTLGGIFGEAGVGGTLSAAWEALKAGNFSGALGSIAPYAAAAYGLYRLISGVGTGRSRGPAYQEFSAMTGAGADIGNFFAINNPAGGQFGGGHYNAQLRALLASITGAAGALGGTASRNLQYGLYTSTSPDGLGQQAVGTIKDALGNVLFDYNKNGGSLAEAIPGMILVGLQQSRLPTRIAEYFNSVSAQGITQETLDQMIQAAAAAHQMADAFKDLGGPFAALSDISVEARLALADLTGGLDAFASKVSQYYNDYYSPEERQALSLVEAQRTLSAAGIDTSGLTSRGDFRALLESINPATNPEQFAALINAAGSFAAGSELLGLSGMNLRDFTAGAPGLEIAIDPVVSAQMETNDLLRQIAANTAPGAQQVVVDVRVNEPALVEVGLMASSAGN